MSAALTADALALPARLAGVSAALLLMTRAPLAALSLGEEVARSSGVDLHRLTWLTLIGVAAGIGASVAVAGVIGFVGLVVPHLVRPLTDRRPSRLIVPSALAGALLVVIADAAVRVLPLASELRLGIALSLIGGPFFLALVLRIRAQGGAL